MGWNDQGFYSMKQTIFFKSASEMSRKPVKKSESRSLPSYPFSLNDYIIDQNALQRVIKQSKLDKSALLMNNTATLKRKTRHTQFHVRHVSCNDDRGLVKETISVTQEIVDVHESLLATGNAISIP
jgi:hypothetical protein